MLKQFCERKEDFKVKIHLCICKSSRRIFEVKRGKEGKNLFSFSQVPKPQAMLGGEQTGFGTWNLSSFLCFLR
jgi:hypothetical protein